MVHPVLRMTSHLTRAFSKKCILSSQVLLRPQLPYLYRQYASATHAATSTPPSSALPERPTSLAYFTGSPVFYDLIVEMESKIKAMSSEPILSRDPAQPQADGTTPPPAWLSQRDMSQLLGIPLQDPQYLRIISCLDQLRTKSHPDLAAYVARFEKTVDSEKLMHQQASVDPDGVAHAVGRRKEAMANVSLLRGDGHVMINGKTLAEYFVRVHDRESVVYPFQVTKTLGMYNVWCTTQGGGLSGKAEAIAHGIAQALVAQQPELSIKLNEVGVLQRDKRRVERKKPGQPKARKKFTWVKR